jgi:hypothetical protein
MRKLEIIALAVGVPVGALVIVGLAVIGYRKCTRRNPEYQVLAGS